MISNLKFEKDFEFFDQSELKCDSPIRQYFYSHAYLNKRLVANRKRINQHLFLLNYL
jgi:hypothetical protein